jgi:hypothetical protein
MEIKDFIPKDVSARLTALIRDMGSFDSNVNADLKSGFVGAREDIGEAQPLRPDGTCEHPFLIPNVNRTMCCLPQRIDIVRHFVLTGGVDGAREPYESLIERVSSFGKYIAGNLARYPVVEDLFQSENFQSAAKKICPTSKQVLDPFQFNAVINVPGQTVASHIDAPYFLGATRKETPQWLHAVMQFSNLFPDRFIGQVQIVGYLHEWFANGSKAVGGEFIYYPGPGQNSGFITPEPRTGNAVDGSKTIHAAMIYKPHEVAPAIGKNDDAALKYVGNEKWHLEINGAVKKVYSSDDLRISIVYRARCFESEEAKSYFYNIPESDKLSVETVLEVLKTDLVTRKEITREKIDAMTKLDLALYLMDKYIAYPLPSKELRWIPYNYCALPRLFPWSKPLVSLFC